MQGITDFFVDSLVWPAYIYFAAYGFVWMIAWGLARLLKNQNSIEQAVKSAWVIAFIMHIIGGTVLIIWLSGQATHRFADWWYIPLYLVFYILIMIVDVCLLVSLLTQKSKKQDPNAPTLKSVGKSRNPKKRP